jgi:hypothetical protein
MKIGISEIFTTEKAYSTNVTTKFFFIGLPLFPIKSYFVYNNIVELGSCGIPLNAKNIAKNYVSFFLIIISFSLLLQQLLSIHILNITYDLNPYYYEMIEMGIPLHLIEKLITIFILALTVYFVFFFGRISDEEKLERHIFLKCDYSKRPFPNEGYVPLAYKFLNESQQHTMLNQLRYLLFKFHTELKDETEQLLLSNEDVLQSIQFVKLKWREFLKSKSYIGKDEETLALCFMILTIEKALIPEDYDSISLEKIKSMLCEEHTF